MNKGKSIERFGGGDFSNRKPKDRLKAVAMGLLYKWWLNRRNMARFATKAVRNLEIGPGQEPLNGFEALNVTWSTGTDFVASAAERLPFKDASFDLIYASHILEHAPWYKIAETLREWHRVLKPLGRIEIWVPDGLKIARAFVDAEDGLNRDFTLDDWYRFNPDKDPAIWASGRIFSYGDGTGRAGHYNWHLSLFSERLLLKHLEDAGFVDVRSMDRSQVRGYDHGWINLGVEGRKA